ncbi:ankyrin repeat domain-containing protein [Wolbachia endosymbiont of Cimex lectularius]|uniref:ankyrin repeat domain-containing protein n=1 Tax=Wolbachia endosymbiont of Cimex lectularius TaxID=246273 RepID=UPI0021013A02|nr:ankyrin repeat domain-containing protein [Wolbachia endosymbiont of Cimex lectularius]
MKNNDGKIPVDLTTNQEIKDLLQSAQKSNNDKLLSAAKDGNIEDVEHLINEGADVNAANKEGDTPLILAIRTCLKSS